MLTRTSFASKTTETTFLIVFQVILFDSGSGSLSEKNGIMWEKFPNWGSDPNPLLDVYLPSYFWHAKMAPNQSCMSLVVKKNGNMWETFPTEGGSHLFPTQLFSLGPEL